MDCKARTVISSDTNNSSSPISLARFENPLWPSPIILLVLDNRNKSITAYC